VRIVLDTNVFISGVFFGGLPFQILRAWRNGKVTLALSIEILEEYQRVGRTLAKKFPGVDLDTILDLLAVSAELVSAPDLPEPVCEDPEDDLRCRRCGAEMRLIAFITDFRQTSRILEHIGEQTIRPPPLTAKTSPPGLSRPEFVDYIPDVNVYVQDPIYPD
jgi:putative PIN family toxin of toxin-antitoxin system